MLSFLSSWNYLQVAKQHDNMKADEVSLLLSICLNNPHALLCSVFAPPLHSYKFTLSELYSMRASVTLRVESYKKWLFDMQDVLENKSSKKRGLWGKRQRQETLSVSPSSAFALLLKMPYCFCFWLALEELHSLVDQAETMAFPHTNLLDQLRVVTAEADKVAVMAQQLLNGKRQTR